MSRPAFGVIPGTFEDAHIPEEVVEVGDGRTGLRRQLVRAGALGVHLYVMGECRIIVAREPAAKDGSRLWHLSVSCADRHPTWDEIKTARYVLLPQDLCFGVLLPPAEFYVNVPEQDHVFHLFEITDPREPWTGE